jgi:PAS domain S-box-containing protein
MEPPGATDKKSKCVLVVGGIEAETQHLTRILDAAGLVLNYVFPASDQECESVLVNGGFDLIIYPFVKLQFNTYLFQLIKKIQPQTPLILVSELVNVQEAVDWMRQGASGYVEKTDLARLIEMVRQELKTGLSVKGIQENSEKSAGVENNSLHYQKNIKAILDTMQEAVVALSLPERKLLYASNSFESIYGYPVQNFLDNPDFHKLIIYPDDLNLFLEAINKYRQEGLAELEYRIIWPDGAIRWLHRRIWMIFDEQNLPVQINDSARDITAQRRAEENLRKTSDWIRLALEASDLGKWQHNITTDYIRLDERARVHYGLNQEIVTLPMVIKRIHPDDVDRLAQEVATAQAPESNGRYITEYRVIHDDGSIHWLAIQVQVYFEGEGEARHATMGFGTSQDITLRHTAEDTLRSSEEKFSKAFASSPDSIIISSLETGRYLEVNESFLQDTGFTRDEIIGHSSLERSIWADPEERNLLVKTIKEQGSVQNMEARYRRKTGEIRYALISAEIIELKGERCLLSVVRDITERKQAESTLQFQANLLSQVSDAIIATDKNLIITAWNEAATRIYGWTEAEAIGQPIDVFLKTEWPDIGKVDAQKFIGETGHWRGEVRQHTRDGQLRYIFASVSLVFDHANLIGGVTVNRDITERKRRETLQSRLSQVLELVAETRSLPPILEKLVLAVEEYQPDIMASVLLLDNETRQLRHGAAPSLPDGYNATIDGVIIGTGVGSCGTAAFEKRLVIVEDIQTDPLWQNFRELAQTYGLQACWSQPIFNHDGTVLGTFALYYRTPHKPTEAEIELIQLAAHLAGIAIRHKQSEEALRTSEEKYRSLIESSNAAIAMLDMKGNILFINNIGASLFGMPPEKLIGKNAAELFPPDQLDLLIVDLQDVINPNAGKYAEFELEINGGKVWFRTNIQPVRDSAGNPYAALFYAAEVTDIKKAEFALIESEARYRSVVEDQTELICRFDKDFNLTFVNRAYSQPYGLTPEDMLGTNLLNYIPTDQRENAAALVRSLSPEKPVSYTEHQSIMPDGSMRWFEWTDRAIFDASGKLIEYQGVGRDVTERKEWESNLRLLQAAVIGSNDAIFITDTNFNIIYVNPALTRISGYLVEEVFGKNPELLLNPETEQDTLWELAINMRLGKHFTGEMQTCHKNGNKLYVEWSTDPIRGDTGEITHFVTILRDISERKMAEEAVRNSEEKYRSLVESFDSAIFMWNGNGDLLFANEVALNILGLDKEKSLGLNIKEIFPPEAGEKYLKSHREVFEKGKGWEYEEHLSLGSESRWFHTSLQPVRDAYGNVIATLVNTNDITHTKEVELALRRSEEQFRQFMRYLPGAVFIKDAQGITEYCNDLYAGIIGKTPAEIIGKLNEDYLSPELTSEYNLENQMVLAEGHVKEFFSAYPGSDGMTYWKTVKFPIPRENLAPLLGAISLDVTGEKRAEEALRASEKRYREMFELHGLPKFIIDPDTGSIFDANPAAAKYYGYSIETLKFLKAFDLSYLTPEEVKKKFRIAINSDVNSYFSVHRSAGNNPRDVEVFTVPIEIEGKKLLYITVTDITEQNQAKQALEEANKLLEQRVQERTAALESTKNRLEAIFNSSGDGIVLVDTEYNIRQSNSAFENLFKIPANSFSGLKLLSLFDSECVIAIETVIEEVVESHNTQQVETRAIRSDGTKFEVEISIAPVNKTNGKIHNLVCIIRDITERKKAQQAIAEERNLLRTVIDTVPDFIFVLDQQQRVILSNLSHIRASGASDPTEIAGRSGNELYPAEFAERFAEEDAQILRTGQALFNVEGHYPIQEGFEIWGLTTKVPLRNLNGEIIGLVGITHDVTHLKASEEALRRSQAVMRSLLDSTNTAFTLLDRDGVIRVVNRLAQDTTWEYYGTSLEVGHSIYEYLPERQHGILRERIERALNGENLAYEEMYFYRNKRIYYEFRYYPVKAEDGEIIGVTAAHEEITDRKEAEQQLRYFASLLDHMNEAVIGTDLDFRIQGWNKAAERMFGWSNEEAIGKDLKTLIYKVTLDGESYDNSIKSLFKDGIWNGEVIQYHRDGTQIYTLTSMVLNRDENGKAIGIIAVNHDITTRKIVEAVLEQKHQEELLMQVYLRGLHEVSIELARIEKLDDFYRIVVEKGLNYFGFERVGMLLYDSTANLVIGTYGTDENGNILDEHQLQLEPSQLTGILKRTMDRHTRFAFDEEVELYANLKPIGVGDNAVAALWDGELLGWLAIDNGIRHKAITHIHLDILAQYALTVGSLLARKKAEMALAESESRFRLLAENVTDMIHRHSPEGINTYFTPSAKAITGYAPEELIGLSPFELVHSDDMPDVLTSLEKIMNSPEVNTISYRNRRKDGTYVWLETKSQLLRNSENGEPLEIISVTRDISERKAAEEALRALSERLELATRSGNIGIFDWDIVNDKLVWDERMLEIYGLTAEEFSGTSAGWLKYVYPEDVPPLERLENRDKTDKLQVEVEFRIVRPDETIRYVKSAAYAFYDLNNKPVRMVGINLDITPLKQAEENLLKALEKERELGELKSRFVSMASHEFRTPLAAILATTETLTIYRNRMDDVQINTRLDKIRQQVNHMKDIMEDVLHLAKIQAGRVDYKPVRGDLDEFCRDILEEFENQPANQGKLIYECGTAPLYADYDIRLMRHIISNLISNALKYSDTGTPVHIHLELENSQIILTVEDKGIGIPTEDLKHIFEPFHRAKNVHTISGTGLGLSITKQAVEMHGGTIMLSSQVGVGTICTVMLPLNSNEGDSDDKGSGN